MHLRPVIIALLLTPFTCPLSMLTSTSTSTPTPAARPGGYVGQSTGPCPPTTHAPRVDIRRCLTTLSSIIHRDLVVVRPRGCVSDLFVIQVNFVVRPVKHVAVQDSAGQLTFAFSVQKVHHSLVHYGWIFALRHVLRFRNHHQLSLLRA